MADRKGFTLYSANTGLMTSNFSTQFFQLIRGAETRGCLGSSGRRQECAAVGDETPASRCTQCGSTGGRHTGSRDRALVAPSREMRRFEAQQICREPRDIATDGARLKYVT